jgi:hypothetical protein
MDENNSNRLRITLLENMTIATWNSRGINQKMPRMPPERLPWQTYTTIPLASERGNGLNP